MLMGGIFLQKRNLYATQNNPYYIYAPEYTRRSAGVKVLHYLCHSLNLIGENAFVINDKTAGWLRTPVVTQQIANHHLSIGLSPIVIYPEVVHGNPLSAKNVVRYLLNVPGLLGGPCDYEDSDMIFAFAKALLPSNASDEHVLLLPTIDVNIFNFDPKLFYPRDTVVYYFGHYTKANEEYPEMMKYLSANAIQITSEYPETHEELADLFRRSKLCVCFHSSTLVSEAILCGCPAYIVDTPYTKTWIGKDELPFEGFCKGLDDESIRIAMNSIDEYVTSYHQLENNFWKQLDNFVSITQKKSKNFPSNA